MSTNPRPGGQPDRVDLKQVEVEHTTEKDGTVDASASFTAEAETDAAREAGEAWVRRLVGVDRQVTEQERRQTLGELFDRWFPPEQTSR